MSDVLWFDDYSQDSMGSTFIVTSGNTQPDESMYSEFETTTPAPEWGEFKECLLLFSYSVS